MDWLSRRSVLASMGAGALAGPAFAQAAGARPSGIIDVHHHLTPPDYLKAKRVEIEATMPTRLDTLGWTPQQSLDHMDKSGGRMSMLSLSAPGCWFGDDAEGRKLARMTNDYGAGLVRDHPHRFGLFAAIPWPDVPGALAEIEYAFDTLKADGVGFMNSYDGRYPGEPRYWPIWEELNRRKAVVYFHPRIPGCCAAPVKGVAPATLEFMFDNTRAIASLMANHVFPRCPDINFIFSHGGGALPMLADRMTRGIDSDNAAVSPPLRGGAMAELRRLHYDTASIANEMSWAALSRMAPMSQILFGTDFPFGSIARTHAQLAGLGLAPGDLAAVEHGNAERLIPRAQRG